MTPLGAEVAESTIPGTGVVIVLERQELDGRGVGPREDIGSRRGAARWERAFDQGAFVEDVLLEGNGVASFASFAVEDAA